MMHANMETCIMRALGAAWGCLMSYTAPLLFTETGDS